jgi:hypothetical protein
MFLSFPGGASFGIAATIGFAIEIWRYLKITSSDVKPVRKLV